MPMTASPNSDHLLPGYREIAPLRAIALPAGFGLLFAAVLIWLLPAGTAREALMPLRLILSAFFAMGGTALLVSPPAERRIPHR